jgi:hypothetical protein
MAAATMTWRVGAVQHNLRWRMSECERRGKVDVRATLKTVEGWISSAERAEPGFPVYYLIPVNEKAQLAFSMSPWRHLAYQAPA